MRVAADLFNKDAISRPLFEPLSEEHERPDEWSGPLGFVIGGFSRPSMQAERDGALAEQYFAAAGALVDTILDRRVADYQVANAALFLYRHSFELLLKAGLPPEVRAEKDIHDLGKLSRSYAHHKRRAGETVPPWIIKRCDELAAIDPGSEAFRYGEYGTPRAKDGKPIIDEIHVDLLHLKVAMAALNAALVEQNWLIRMARGERP
ncbi:hypothetical protein CYK37_30465 [Mesorhizobium loti]|nr:hypothetical protein [Mesorhizobium loti]PLP55475.1 hypothetical protein CYK37_30465 [Mesorhizobium loti]